MSFMRFRRRRSIAGGRIGYKHIIDATTKAVTGGTVRSTIIVFGADNPTLASAASVPANSRVPKLDHVSLEFGQENATPPVSYRWYIWFNPGNAFTPPTPGTEGVSAYKKYIIKSGMEMVGVSASRKTVGSIRIPKKYQTFMNADALTYVWYSDAGANIEDTCQRFIYKDYR